MRYGFLYFLLSFGFSISVLASPQIKIGVSLPLKGEASTYGYDILNSLKFANEELFGGKYDLKVEEDGCSGAQAVSAAHKLVDIEQVKYALGFGCSSAVLSTAQIYERAEVVVISSSAASPEISKAGKYIFRTYPSSESGALILAKFLSAKHKRIGIISEQTDYAQGVAKGLKLALDSSKIDLISEDYLPGTTDFRSILARIRSKNIDSLILNPQAEDHLIMLVRQVTESGWKIPLYGFIFPSSPTFLSVLGQKANGLIFADTPGFNDLANQDAQTLYNKFRTRYGPPKSSDFYFSTTLMAFQALDQAIQSGEAVQPYLESNTFHTIHGDFSFDQNGDPNGIGYVLKIIENGQARLLKNKL